MGSAEDSSTTGGYAYASFESLASGVGYKDSQPFFINGTKLYNETITLVTGGNTSLPLILTGRAAILTLASENCMVTWYLTSTTVTKMYGTANTTDTVGAGTTLYASMVAGTGGGIPYITNNVATTQNAVITMTYY